MVIDVLHPGLSTTIQDSGRLNGLAFGVPKCGWIDKELAHFANALVGNSRSSAVLECTVQGGVYKFRETSLISIVGECFASVEGRAVQVNQKIQVNAGETLNLKSNGKGRYYYLAFQGKIECEKYFGSYSTYEYAKKGGFKGRKLKKGDVLSIKDSINHSRKTFLNVNYSKNIRILKAPETSEFDKNEIQRLNEINFVIDINSNRMGYRLSGCELKGTRTGNIISSGCIPGTIQVPPSGKPIVLMVDSPTTGGYPRIAVIHPDDLGSFAQRLPGEKVNFYWDD